MSNSNGENNVCDRCRVCAFVFVNKRRKRKLDGEFLKKIDQVFNENVWADDGLPRAVCDTCKSRKIKEAAQHFQKKIKSWKAVLERVKRRQPLRT